MTMASVIKCICDSSRGNTREPDVNGGGRRRTCVWGRVGVLLSSLGSLEGTLLGLLTLPHSFSLAVTDLNNLSHIIYLAHQHSHSRSHLLIDANTHSHTHMPWGVWSWVSCGASWNSSRRKPDRHSLCQTYEVTLINWCGVPRHPPTPPLRDQNNGSFRNQSWD